MTTTTNYGMQLPAGTDPASITPINQNTTFLDTKLKELEDVTDSVIDEIDKNTSTSSGSVITLTDEAPLTPLKSCVCDIEPVQASGTPSPDNPLAISGWSGVNVSVCGKNLFNPTNLINDRTIDADGSIAGYGGRVATPDYISIKPNTSICLSYSKNVSSNVVFIYALYNNGTLISRVANNPMGAVIQTGNANQVRFAFYDNVTKDDLYNIQLEYGSVATTYEEPYNNTTTTLTWTDAGIVYGGSVDLTSGVLTVTYMGVDLGDLTWSANAQDSYAFNSVLPSASVNGNNLEFICSSYVGYTSTTLSNYDYGISISQDGTRVYVKNKDYPNSDINAFKTASQGVIFVYKLATPITYQLTPTTIKTLSTSPTNIWADTGDTSATYVVKDEYSYGGIPTVEAVKSYIAEMLGI